MSNPNPARESWADYDRVAQAAYNLYYGPEHLTQAKIGVRLGVSQQMAGTYIRHWAKKIQRETETEARLKIVIPEGPVEKPVPNSIAELTATLGYADKMFHREWYDFAILMRQFLLLAPRRHAKSTCLSINYVLWRIIKNPNIRILLVSNTDLQARGFVRVVKQLIEAHYPQLRPEGREKWAETSFAVKRDAVLRDLTLRAVGVNGPIISTRCDLIVCDDVVDPENADTEAMRDKVYDWFFKVLIPCLEPNGQIIVVGTPFGPDDLYARLQKDNWPFRKYDAIVNEDRKESLWPEVLPYECKTGLEEGEKHRGHCCLVGLRRQMGSIRFNAQYRCDASGYAGEKFKIEWLKPYYRSLPDKLDEIVIGVDPAITEKTGGDYFAMASVGYSEKENLIYVMDFYRAHLTFPDQLAAIAEWWRLKGAARIIIESNAYQRSLAQGIQGMGLPVIPYKTLAKDKTQRLLNISPYFENRTIRVKEDMDTFIEEYTQFDKGKHDDLLDALYLAVTDIVDRRIAKRADYHLMMQTGNVFKSRLNLPMSSSEAGTISTLQVAHKPKPIIPQKERVICLSCGKTRGSCQHSSV